MFTIEPPVPRSIRWAQTSRINRAGARTFTAKHASMSIGPRSRNGPSGCTPALLTSTSTLPIASIAARTIEPTASTSLRSAPWIQRRSACGCDARTDRRASPARSVASTCAPSSRNASTMPRPIPRAPPVTMTRTPSKRMSPPSQRSVVGRLSTGPCYVTRMGTQPPLAPLTAPRSLAEDAADRIREQILAGGFSQGEHLVEAKIAEQLAISRGPVREAFKLLRAEGLLMEEPRRGTFVVSLTADDVREIYGLRDELGRRAERTLAPNHTSD